MNILNILINNKNTLIRYYTYVLFMYLILFISIPLLIVHVPQ